MGLVEDATRSAQVALTFCCRSAERETLPQGPRKQTLAYNVASVEVGPVCDIPNIAASDERASNSLFLAQPFFAHTSITKLKARLDLGTWPVHWAALQSDRP